MNKDPTLVHDNHRMWEIEKPAQKRKLDARESVRRKNRMETEFYCKYMLAKLDKKVPLK
jgi:hypothetical protein